MSCPLCGAVNYQYPIEEFPSATRYECGVCTSTYGVKKVDSCPEGTERRYGTDCLPFED